MFDKTIVDSTFDPPEAPEPEDNSLQHMRFGMNDRLLKVYNEVNHIELVLTSARDGQMVSLLLNDDQWSDICRAVSAVKHDGFKFVGVNIDRIRKPKPIQVGRIDQ